LEQRISSPKKQKWVTKILGYGYEIIYKKVKEIVVVDVLSQKYEKEGSIFSLSFIVADWLNEIHNGWLTDPKISSIIQQLQMALHAYQGYT
jgi:hypothetical protein